jgi:hypothetical protein
MFTLKMSTANEAFDPVDSCEVARILRVIASNLENSERDGKCMDINGNTVGSWKLK